MFNSIFKIVYFIEFLVATIVRKYYTSKFGKSKIVKDRKSLPEILLLTIVGIGMVVPLFYVFSTWLDFADYTLPSWIGWIGVSLFGLAIWLIWRSHADLGKQWTPIPAITENHKLVTNGVFGYIRHPMYAAHLLWAISQVLILQNWIAGFSFLVVLIPQYLYRVGREEEMMIDQFGDEYRKYMIRTGRIIPRF